MDYLSKTIAKTFISSSRYRFDFDLSFVDRDTYIYSDSTAINFTNFNWNIYDLIKDRTIETEVQYKLSKNHSLTAGAQLRNIDFDLGINYELTTQDTFFTWNPLYLKTVLKSLLYLLKTDGRYQKISKLGVV